MDARTHWTDDARARHFIIPDDAELPPGGLALRTSLGRERTVDASAAAPFEVSEEEARAWAAAQLGEVIGEMRQQTLGFVERLRQKTAEMRDENRRTWRQAVADAPPEVRDAGAHLRDILKDLGATLREAAREYGAAAAAEERASAASSADAPAADAPSAARPSSTERTDDSRAASADDTNPPSAAAGAPSAGAPSATAHPSGDTDPPGRPNAAREDHLP